MGQTTFANGRGIAHKKSGGMSIAFPDVCMHDTKAGDAYGDRFTRPPNGAAVAVGTSKSSSA